MCTRNVRTSSSEGRENTERNPARFNFSPTLVAIAGAIIGHDYGVRDEHGFWPDLTITSDGFVIAGSTAAGGAYIGEAAELERNLARWKAGLTDADCAEFERLFDTSVTDWRRL
jgi:hypothetical protein